MPSASGFLNPFRRFRAEQFDENLWAYYVEEPFEDLLGTKPIVVEGGRGSGKTMFFLCNSWRDKRYSIEANRDSLSKLIEPSQHVGLYYRVDTPFTASLHGGGHDDRLWSGVFATYLSACLLREMTDFLIECVRTGVVPEHQMAPFLSRLSQMTSLTPPLESLFAAKELLGRLLDGIERLANNPMGEWKHGTTPGRLLAECVASLRDVASMAKMNIYVFIDEYESLLDYQQRQINSLIKHSSARFVYNIGLRPSGMRTSKTMSDTEHIEEPHDYRRFKPELALSPDGPDPKKLEKVLRDICRKRFENARLFAGASESKWCEIEEYLGRYSVDEELRLFGKHSEQTLEELSRLIARDVVDADERERYQCLLGSDASPANARLHVCLLQRAPQYRPSVKQLASEYSKWMDNPQASKKYYDWWHNTKMGLVFLLAHEHHRQKTYSGVDVFAMLSSGIIRHFIELCEQAFDFAHSNGFDWGSPRRLTDEEQTRAARYVSKYKLSDLERYPMGARLRQLTMSLGTIFQALHRNRKTTLGEPEVNHFSVSADDIASNAPDLRALLSEAVLWAVLQVHPSSKDKEIERRADALDYHLNHIYCPYFGISYRQKRKIELSARDIRSLSGEDASTVRGAIRVVLAGHKIVSDDDGATGVVPQLPLLPEGV